MIEVQATNQVSTKGPISFEKHGLKAVDVRKSFRAPNGDRVEVLRGVTLDVSPGESVAIIGASGSGKSTLLHLLGGLDTPDHGTISIGKVDLGQLRGSEVAGFREKQVGFVFQFHYLLSDLTAIENVSLPLLISRHTMRKARAEALRLLTEIGMELQADYPVTQLSGGEQQRIAVARAMICQPALLIADEPTGNLDTLLATEVAGLLVNYAKAESRITLIATHNESVARLCDRVLELKNGRIYP